MNISGSKHLTLSDRKMIQKLSNDDAKCKIIAELPAKDNVSFPKKSKHKKRRRKKKYGSCGKIDILIIYDIEQNPRNKYFPRFSINRSWIMRLIRKQICTFRKKRDFPSSPISEQLSDAKEARSTNLPTDREL